MNMRSSHWALVAVLLVGLLSMGARGQTTVPGAWAPFQGVGIDQHLNAQVPLGLVFRDETGASVRLADLQRGRGGRPVVLVLVYYRCPSLCTAVLNDMMSTLKVIPQTIGDQYDVWTVSFDPAETAELAASKKKGYVKSYERTRGGAEHVSEGWHFLTGDAKNIAALTSAVGYRYRWDAASSQFIHPAALTILTPEGRISRYFFGVDFDQMDVRLALVDASHGTIGTLTDKVLLFCYHYDPTTGRYGFAVLRALKVGGALTVLLMGGLIGMLWRADRRRTRRLLAAVEKPAEMNGERGESS
jgi:protein SCO1/2